MPDTSRVLTTHDHCSFSTGIDGGITAGRGKLDWNGYWEIPCDSCAQFAQSRYDKQIEDEKSDQALRAERDALQSEVTRLTEKIHELTRPMPDSEYYVRAPDGWMDEVNALEAKLKQAEADNERLSARVRELEAVVAGGGTLEQITKAQGVDPTFDLRTTKTTLSDSDLDDLIGVIESGRETT